MASPVYRFGRFRLDPQARELQADGEPVPLPLSTVDCLTYLIDHRDRPIGRDELASAVWGRVDVSEASLNHAVMRLRRLFGDTGNEQRVIRTVPKLGYRWILPVEAEVEADTPPPADLPVTPSRDVAATAPVTESPLLTGIGIPASVVADPPVSTDDARKPPRRTFGIALALIVLVVLAAAIGLSRQSKTPAAVTNTAASTAVWPFQIDAPAEWSWLRYGLMDLVATQLQRSGIATVPSETIVALSRIGHQPPTDAAAANISARATFNDGQWLLHLERRDGTDVLTVDARHTDPIRAARNAVDELAIKLGRTPPVEASSNDVLATETLKRRINAAVFAGQLDVARRLVDDASTALRSQPDIALSQASIDFFAGRYDASRRTIEALLPTLPADTPDTVRARALNTLGAAQFRLGQIDDAERSYTESVQRAALSDDPGVLARAYIGLGGVASQRMQLESAASSYGRARTLHALRNDTFGIAAVDLNLGMNALQRGQPANALTTLRDAAARFRELRANDPLVPTLSAQLDAQILLLDDAAALATSNELLELDARLGNPRQHWEILFARAQALIATGRLSDADGLLSQILDSSNATEDASIRLLSNAMLAQIALLRGQSALAAELARPLLVPALELRNRQQYAHTWLTLCRSLQLNGERDAAAVEVARLRSWSLADPGGGDRLIALLAEAGQAELDVHPDIALSHYAEAMALATRRGIPDEIVMVGAPYVRLLLSSSRREDALSVNGRLSPFADRDARAAETGARVYEVLGDEKAAQQALRHARLLARERLAWAPPERPQ